MSRFICLCTQLLGHERQRCHLVGDQGTCARFNHGSLTFCLSSDNITTILTLPMIFISFFNINIFVYRSTLFSSLASSSSSSRSYSPQISVEMNPVFTCETFDFSFCLTLKQHILLAAIFIPRGFLEQLCKMTVLLKCFEFLLIFDPLNKFSALVKGTAFKLHYIWLDCYSQWWEVKDSLYYLMITLLKMQCDCFTQYSAVAKWTIFLAHD